MGDRHDSRNGSRRRSRARLGDSLLSPGRSRGRGILPPAGDKLRDEVNGIAAEFADAFAQMLAYGLFLARLNSDSNPITLHNAREHVPILVSRMSVRGL